MPFGTSSAVSAWHRIGVLIKRTVQELLIAQPGRFVDDFFGTEVVGVHWTGGRCLELVTQLMGIPCDPDKSADNEVAMGLLGTRVCIDEERQGVTTMVDQDKASRWGDELCDIVLTGQCDSGLASKYVGRLNFAVKTAACKEGCAFLKPLRAQAKAPRAKGQASLWVQHAAW